VRLGLFVSAVCAVVAVSVAPFAQAQTVPGAGPPSGAPLAAGALAAGPLDADPQGSANENPPALDKAARDAIPLTPAMIEELAKRYNASRRAEEQSMIEPAAPINREVNVSFAPGAATSIVNTVKGYPGRKAHPYENVR
jgi:hypothetical protein